jgi:hypothetical protein
MVRERPGRRFLALVLTAMMGTACAVEPPPPTRSAPSASVTATPAASSVEASPSPSTDEVPLPQFGQPFDAVHILNLMRESRRPGGVPAVVQERAIAERIADAIVTYGGQPWETATAGGTCGSELCTVELAGTVADVAGEDLWVFEVEPDTGRVTLASAELRALPGQLVSALDGLARRLTPQVDRDDMVLTTVRWLMPPEAAHFLLAYRSGGEEGSCTLDVELDADAGEVVDVHAAGC